MDGHEESREELAAITPRQEAVDIREAILAVRRAVVAWQAGLPPRDPQRHPARACRPRQRCLVCQTRRAAAAAAELAGDDVRAAVAAAHDALDHLPRDETVQAAIAHLHYVAHRRRDLAAHARQMLGRRDDRDTPRGTPVNFVRPP